MWIVKRWIVLFAFVMVFFLKGLLAAEEGEQYPGMVYVPAGEFYMGEDKYYDWTFMLAFNIYDGPEHIVYLDSYYIDKYEVTNEQYAKFIEETGHRIPYCWFDERFNTPDKPVVGVRWEDAVAYAEWAANVCLQRQSGKKQRVAVTGVCGLGGMRYLMRKDAMFGKQRKCRHLLSEVINRAKAPTVAMICRVMSGNGVLIGMIKITIILFLVKTQRSGIWATKSYSWR